MDYIDEEHEIARLEGEGGALLSHHDSKRLGIVKPVKSEIIDIYGPVATPNGDVYFGSDKDRLYALGRASKPEEIQEYGEIKWERYIDEREVPQEFKPKVEQRN